VAMAVSFAYPFVVCQGSMRMYGLRQAAEKGQAGKTYHTEPQGLRPHVFLVSRFMARLKVCRKTRSNLQTLSGWPRSRF
jgi:hypothetical protein